jgi:hypothetical protein
MKNPLEEISSVRKSMPNQLRALSRASSHSGLVYILFDMILHKILINTDPRDYLKYKFYQNGKSLKEKSRYISPRYGSRYYPHGNNLLKFNKIFTDKYIEKAILEYFNLPVAKLLTTIGNKLLITNQNQLNVFLDAIESDIVIKPISGTHGSGFLLLSRRGNELFAGKKKYSNLDVWIHVSRGLKRGYIVEEKIINVKGIRAIHPASLNTFRFIMIKTDDGKWHQAACVIKFGTGESQVDNVSVGGIIAEVDRAGKTVYAYDVQRGKPITQHPDSGLPLMGLQLEGYREASALAMEASSKFDFMGAIGWDIAASVTGPMIVEGNAWWGVNAVQLRRGLITDELARGLRKRNIFSLWDKTRMSPWIERRNLFGQIRLSVF